MITEAKGLGYTICKGYPDRDIDVVGGRYRAGFYNKGQIDESLRDCMPGSFAFEEQGIADQRIDKVSLPFGEHRKPVIDALRAIIGYQIFNHNIPTSAGLDIGCGSLGSMVEDLMPIRESDKLTWTQIDVNQDAVEENRRRHPFSNISKGSYLNLGLRDCLPLVTGLSSLDSTAFIDRAVQQVRDALVEGGFFLHVQDVGPCIWGPFQEMVSMGEKFPYNVEMNPSMCPNGQIDESDALHNIAMYHSKEGVLSVVELFRRRIGRAISSTPGMKLLENDWFTAIGLSKSREDACFYNSGYLDQSSNPNLQVVSAVVTLAKKSE